MYRSYQWGVINMDRLDFPGGKEDRQTPAVRSGRDRQSTDRTMSILAKIKAYYAGMTPAQRARLWTPVHHGLGWHRRR